MWACHLRAPEEQGLRTSSRAGYSKTCRPVPTADRSARGTSWSHARQAPGDPVGFAHSHAFGPMLYLGTEAGLQVAISSSRKGMGCRRRRKQASSPEVVTSQQKLTH